MRSYRTILVALDFSDCSQELVDQATGLADGSTQLVLLHAAELPDGLSPGARLNVEASNAETAEQHLQHRSLQRLDKYREDLRAQGYLAETVVVGGHAAEAIVAEAERRNADLIVMGTHGRRGVPKFVGGSVAAQVIASATCPVLTVRTIHKPTCRAQSCDRCDGHITTELRQLMVERDG